MYLLILKNELGFVTCQFSYYEKLYPEDLKSYFSNTFLELKRKKKKGITEWSRRKLISTFVILY